MSEDLNENQEYHPFQIIVISSGSSVHVVLTEFLCQWERRGHPYQIGIEILDARLDENGRKKLSGRVLTYCPICAQVHDAVRKNAEIEFSKSTCPNGHASWEALVISIKRSSATISLEEPLEYEFVVELRCKQCQKVHRRLVGSVSSVISKLTRVKIAITGIEFEFDKR